ncbi:hypothetical protein [Photorhabdus asymbiotica]|uniref:hypothetical protein n=1 Tax=Photorhabdus asymbiotica TaxID=291112 RepID=UPI003DA79739
MNRSRRNKNGEGAAGVAEIAGAFSCQRTSLTPHRAFPRDSQRSMTIIGRKEHVAMIDNSLPVLDVMCWHLPVSRLNSGKCYCPLSMDVPMGDASIHFGTIDAVWGVNLIKFSLNYLQQR